VSATLFHTFIQNPAMFEKLTEEIEQYIPHASKATDGVSKRGVDWHLDHTLRIILSICKTLKESRPENYRPRFHLIGFLILKTGYIPRGKGKAPAAFDSKERVSEERLRGLLEEARGELRDIEGLPPKSFFPHPYFGDLNLKQSHRFIVVHSRHHLKIVRDIVRACG